MQARSLKKRVASVKTKERERKMMAVDLCCFAKTSVRLTLPKPRARIAKTIKISRNRAAKFQAVKNTEALVSG